MCSSERIYDKYKATQAWLDNRTTDALLCAAVGAAAGRIFLGTGHSWQTATTFALAGAAVIPSAATGEKRAPILNVPCALAAAIAIAKYSQSWSGALATGVTTTATVLLWNKFSPTSESVSKDCQNRNALPFLAIVAPGALVGLAFPEFISARHALTLSSIGIATAVLVRHVRKAAWLQAKKPYSALSKRNQETKIEKQKNRVRQELWLQPVSLAGMSLLLATPWIARKLGYPTGWSQFSAFVFANAVTVTTIDQISAWRTLSRLENENQSL